MKNLVKENFWDSIVNYVCLSLCKWFPGRTRTIPCPEAPDKPLLTQFVLISERLYLQHFHNSNEKDIYHDHRWAEMKSFVLSSCFMEERMDEKPSALYHKRFTKYKMSNYTRHRVCYWGEKCWTLFAMGPVVNPNWGYWKQIFVNGQHEEIHIPWHEYISDDVKIPHVETGKITNYQQKEKKRK